MFTRSKLFSTAVWPRQFFFAIALIMAVCAPASAENTVIGNIPALDQQPIVTFSESVRQLSVRSGPPGSFRHAESLQMLPLSHHSLWNRLRIGFQFANLDHPKIDLQIEFLQNGIHSLQAKLANAQPYLRYIVEQIERAHMPIDIALLPLVESAFDPHAKSSQNALGLWQFIPDTGRLYGLHENEWYSGRKDVIASTTAALEYLKRLHNMFDGDWLLALAAYNTGQGNVRSAIKRARSQGLQPNFWNLQLAKETKDYVPRLVAVNKMISKPEAYGIILPPLSDRKTTGTVKLDLPISLQQAAEAGGVSLEQILVLNPGFKKEFIPEHGPNNLLVPLEAVKPLAALNQATKKTNTGALRSSQRSHREMNSARPAYNSKMFKKIDYRRHTVERGDNLWNIARQFDTSINMLTHWNFIDSQSAPLQPGDKLWFASLTSEPEQTRCIRYRVVPTDTITTVTNKFNTRLSALKKWNPSLRHSHSLNPGQLLCVPVHH